jgi:hypothetical protein
MKKGVAWIGLFLAWGAALAVPGGTRSTAAPSVDPDFGLPPLYFIPNKGQTDQQALFYAKTGTYTLWLTRDGLTFDDGAVSRLIFKDANPGAQVSAADPADYRVSYFYGRDESEWLTDIPTSRAVIYKNVYDGIDLKVYGAERQVEYDWIVKPGARPDRIRWAHSGVSKASLDHEGNLVAETPSGRLVHRRPAAYQIIDGRRVDVQAAFRMLGDGEYGFAVGPYDAGGDLVIDPVVLVFSTFLGGSDWEEAFSISIDKTGAIYVEGFTTSSDFPPIRQAKPRQDTFVSKLSADGKSLIYTAYFPTAGYPEGTFPSIIASGTGAVYLAGTTFTRNFPVKNAFQKAYGGGGWDGFLLELAPSGKSLVFSTFLGGSSFDSLGGVGLDEAGSIYVAGMTASKNFPVKNAFQKSLAGNSNLIISKFSPDGQSLVYSTFLGSSGFDILAGMAIDGAGSVYVCGYSNAADFPLKNAFQAKSRGSGETFISKLAPSGQALVYSSYLGGPAYDYAMGLALDGSGAAYIAGVTVGAFPLKNAFQPKRKGGREGFVSKVAPDGHSLVFSTYLGGSGDDYPLGIAVDGSGAAHVVGCTYSPNWPLKYPLKDKISGSVDAFLSILSPSGKSLLHSTYLGGQYKDAARCILVDLKATIYAAGSTNSPDFPMLKPYQKAFAGKQDAIILKFTNGSASPRRGR